MFENYLDLQIINHLLIKHVLVGAAECVVERESLGRPWIFANAGTIIGSNILQGCPSRALLSGGSCSTTRASIGHGMELLQHHH